MKTLIAALCFSTFTPPCSHVCAIEPWHDSIGMWYCSFKRWKGGGFLKKARA